MSIGIFVFALLVALATILVGAVAEECLSSKKVCFVVVCVGTAMTLVIAALSFCYTSFKVLRYSIAYDHVVELEWKPEIMPAPQNLDWSKVVYHDVYSGPGTKECEQVIMVWNDEPEVKYDDLIKMEK